MTHFGSWGIILDDIIFPDGRSAMARIGGGGLYAVCGMRLWSADVRLLAGVHIDFPAELLTSLGLDTQGLIRSELPTPRAWQLFEENGRRTQIPRISRDAWYQQLVSVPTTTPIDENLRWAHFLGRGDALELAWIRQLADRGIILSAEPIIDGNNSAEELATIKACLAHFELFSPGETDLTILVGDGPLPDQLRALAALGPKVVALRQGAKGSIIYTREDDQLWQLPAAPAAVIDVTGAGNAYCGGLLTGWVESGDLVTAAARAAVSAAMTIEQVGPRPVRQGVMAEAQRRAVAFKPHIVRLD